MTRAEATSNTTIMAITRDNQHHYHGHRPVYVYPIPEPTVQISMRAPFEFFLLLAVMDVQRCYTLAAVRAGYLRVTENPRTHRISL